MRQKPKDPKAQMVDLAQPSPAIPATTLPTQFSNDRALERWLNQMVAWPDHFFGSGPYTAQQQDLFHQAVTRYVTGALNDLRPATLAKIGKLIFASDTPFSSILDTVKRVPNLRIVEVGSPITTVGLAQMRAHCLNLTSVTLLEPRLTDLDSLGPLLEGWPKLDILELRNLRITNDAYNAFLLAQPAIESIGRDTRSPRRIILSQAPGSHGLASIEDDA
jgi:hypothetical protein